MPDFAHEQRLGGRVAGIDEVGRGPLSGPVVAAAVILDSRRLPDDLIGLTDSKLLSARRRQEFAVLLAKIAVIGVGAASVAEIDRLNIQQATFLAMQRAVARLSVRPDFALVDGNRAPKLPCPVETLVKGDQISVSIAAASVIAKVIRDRALLRLDARYPGYGWARNAGYPTADHRAAILALGITPHHRQSFAPIRAALAPA